MKLFEINSGKISISISSYIDYMKERILELQTWSEERDRKKPEQIVGYSAEHANQDIIRLENEAKENAKLFELKVKKLVDLIGEKWSGSDIFITPSFQKGTDFSYDSLTSWTVAIGRRNIKDLPNFTIFDMGKIVEDVLDAGDTDFFRDRYTESDYFLLVTAFKTPQAIQTPSRKIIKLYTARPIRDHEIFENAKNIPANVFLTSSLDEAEGYQKEFSDRELWAIWIEEQYLLPTLDINEIKNYQTFNGRNLLVPIQKIAFIG